MKVFIDVGAYTGDTIALAMQKYSDFDMFAGYEPFPPSFRELQKNYGEDEKVKLYNSAVSNKNGIGRLYLYKDVNEKQDNVSLGNSLLSDKVNITKRYIEVLTVDIVDIISCFTEDDYVILKLDVEGSEYDILERLIETDAIMRVSKIYCDWHYGKLTTAGINQRHEALIKKLQELGFEVTGRNLLDEFIEI